MTTKTLFIFLLLLSSNYFSQITDIDVNTYETFKDHLGNSWISSNLRVTHFNNGDPIRHCKTFDEWKVANINKEPAWCYYDFDKKNESLGLLYNYYAAKDTRQIEPEGWKVADESAIKLLTQSYATKKTYSGTLFSYLNSSEGWKNDFVKGNNESGFNGKPTGAIVYKGYEDKIGGYLSMHRLIPESEIITNYNTKLYGIDT